MGLFQRDLADPALGTVRPDEFRVAGVQRPVDIPVDQVQDVFVAGDHRPTSSTLLNAKRRVATAQGTYELRRTVPTLF